MVTQLLGTTETIPRLWMRAPLHQILVVSGRLSNLLLLISSALLHTSDEQWPLGSCFFFVSWLSEIYLQGFLKQAHKVVISVKDTAAANSQDKSKGESKTKPEEANKDK